MFPAAMVYRLVIDPPSPESQRHTLTPEQSHYLFRVLRLSPGASLVALDGRGRSWRARLETDALALEEALSENRELRLGADLAVALPKGNALEEILRPCAELGVRDIYPILSQRALLKPSDQKLDRWRRILAEAAEQCERQWVPQLLPPQSWSEFILHPRENSAQYLCVARCPGPTLTGALRRRLIEAPPQALTLAIGPEGGWTEAEIRNALERGWETVSLGPRILRAATAPVVALAQVCALLDP
ncbi:MAG: 16S rRNA (uracil(1498)-N(3))-methyltransferase [Cyanobacteriota bacterium]|nr:16S rRNA (uracil(1498)-N(3))-methyltransferase [Cyanobacteriota bacterium]